MNYRNTNNNSNNFEQRVQTVIQLAICAVVAWGGSSLITVREGLITVGGSIASLQSTTKIQTEQTNKDISDLKIGLEAVKAQVVTASNTATSATAAATAATTAATTAAAVAATAVSTAAALAAGTKKGKSLDN